MAENSRFEVGETVRLNSGGPLMTVDKLVAMTDGRQEVMAVWFDGANKETHGRFKAETLMKAHAEPVIA
jgi:uncharacterized protein YodC (DUF2158 family)